MPAKTFHITPPHNLLHKIFTASVFFLDIAGIFLLVWLYTDTFSSSARQREISLPPTEFQILNDLPGFESSQDLTPKLKIDKDTAAAIALQDAEYQLYKP